MAVNSISPSSGGSGGGQIVTIDGSNFGKITENVNVTIGSSRCEVLTVNQSRITCMTSSHPKGTAPVVVTVGNNSTSDSVTFEYLQGPTVSNVIPAEGSVTGGEKLVITGSGFGNSSDVRVQIGKADCDVKTVIDSQIECHVSPHGPGAAKVVVIVTEKGRAYGEVSYHFKLKVSSIIPREGSVFGGTRLTLAGEGFSSNSSANKVFVGGKPAKLLSSTSTKIIAETPSNCKTVSVTNGGTHEGN